MVPVGTLVVLRGTPPSRSFSAPPRILCGLACWPPRSWPPRWWVVLSPPSCHGTGSSSSTSLSAWPLSLPHSGWYREHSLTPGVDWTGSGCCSQHWAWAPGSRLETLGGHASNVLAVAVVAAGLLSLAGAVWWMRKAGGVPLFNLSVFGTRTFRATSTGGFIYRLTISSVPFLLPLMFQDGFGWDPLKAGVMVAAVFVGNIGIKPATTPLIRRFGFKPVLVFASFASAVTFALCAFLDARTPEPLIFALLLFSGAFRSIGFSAYASVQYADIVPGQLPSANAISATLVQLAAAAGIAVGAVPAPVRNHPDVRGGRPSGSLQGRVYCHGPPDADQYGGIALPSIVMPGGRRSAAE